jgi:formylglycine-generating enzyme required for sulfatase activity
MDKAVLHGCHCRSTFCGMQMAMGFLKLLAWLTPSWMLFAVAADGRFPLDSTAAATLSEKDMKPYRETIPGTKVVFEMVPIPGGTFMMGSPKEEKGRNDDEGPQHQVEVRAFWMGKYEVTWDEYELFCYALDLKMKKEQGIDLDKQPASEKVADAVTRPTKPYTDMTFGYGREGYPALCMTHHAAMEYCRWLSAKTGKTYRLPTEAEWEYACRAGSKTAYSFGDDARKLDDYAWHWDNADGKPHPVGKKKPNPWGLHDMHGNVSEWCLDHYDKDAYAKRRQDKPVLQPVLIPTDKKTPHVTRGGSWDEDEKLCRSAARRPSSREWWKQDPQRPQSIWYLTEGIFVGFRVVRPLEEQENLKDLRSKVTRESKYGN